MYTLTPTTALLNSFSLAFFFLNIIIFLYKLGHNDIGQLKTLLEKCFELLLTGPGCSSLAYGAVTESGSFRMNKDGKTLFRNNYAWNNGDKTLRLFAPDIYFFHLLYIIKYVMSIKKRKKKVCYVYKQFLYVVANVIFLESSGGGVLVLKYNFGL